MESVVELTSVRIVLFAREGSRRGTLLTLDLGSRTWQDATLRLPADLEVHSPLQVGIGADGRLHLGHTYEGESSPMSWWSYPVPQGGAARPEPSLTGKAVAWEGDLRATADADGRVALSSSGEDRLVADERPAGCERPTDPVLADFRPTVALAGSRPVVTYACSGKETALTVVYAPDGGDAIQVPGASVLAADQGSVLLGGAIRGEPSGTYLLDLDHESLVRISPAAPENEHDVAGGLVLWNTAGPIDDTKVYDVVWQVARVPSFDLR